MTRNIGYLIHPTLTPHLPPNAHIADLATGTALFLQRLAATNPAYTFHGSDISPALFPPDSTLPPNITLTTLDIRQPPPAHLIQRYDLVHVRQLSAGLEATDWPAAIAHAAALVRPGGALQWEECDFLSVRHLRGGVENSVGAAGRMGDVFKDALRERFAHGWNCLERGMRDAGLVGVEKEVVSSDRVVGTREALTRNGLGVIEAWMRRVVGRGVALDGLNGAGNVDELARRAEEDVRRGCYVRFDVHVVWGWVNRS